MSLTRRFKAAAAALFSPDLSRLCRVEIESLRIKLVEAKLQQLATAARVSELQHQIHYLILTQMALRAETGPEELPSEGDVLVRMDQETFADFAARRPPTSGKKQ